MNHELIMLREVKRVGKLAQSLKKEVQFRAVKSYASATVKNGTLGQIEEINRLAQLRDDCLLFCRAVLNGLNSIDKDNRSLLVAYYLKGAPVGALADRLNTNNNGVYSKLFCARLEFRKALIKLGFDEQWLRDRYSYLNFIAARFKKA